MAQPDLDADNGAGARRSTRRTSRSEATKATAQASSAPGQAEPALSNIDRRRLRARSKPSQAYLDRRLELVQAAARVISRKGISGTTINDIAVEAGSDRANIYYYVASKEELLAEILRDAMLDHLESLEVVARSALPATDKVRGLIRATMASFDKHYPYLYLWVYEDPSRPEGLGSASLSELIDISQRSYEIMREVIADGIRQGEFQSPLPVGVLTQSVIGLVAWTYRWYRPGQALSAEDVADGLCALLIHGLAVPEPGSPPTASGP